MEPSYIESIYDIFSTDTFSALFPNYLNDLSRLRLRRIVNNAYEKSPYYRKKFERDIENHTPYEYYPISNKMELMAYFDQVVTDQNIRLSEIKQFILTPENIGRPFKDKYFIWESSGTNGMQGIYIQDRGCITRYQAIEAVRKPINSIFNQCIHQTFNNERVAYIGALEHHYASTVSLAILKNDFPHLQKSIRNFSIFTPIQELIAQLTEYEPSVLITYPSMATCLAHHPSIDIHPREIWLGGEHLSIRQRSYIEDKLRSKITCSYGASECLPIAWECCYQKLHVNSDWVLLEAVDKNYLPIPAGTPSYTTLLTNFTNTTQPIIRYDLGDQISYSTNTCLCGSKLPHIELTGRTNDCLEFTDAHGKTLNIPALSIIGLIEEHGIFNGVISGLTQNKVDSRFQDLNISFRADSYPSEQKIKHLQRYIDDYLSQNHIINVSILCTKYEHNCLGTSGKAPCLRA